MNKQWAGWVISKEGKEVLITSPGISVPKNRQERFAALSLPVFQKNNRGLILADAEQTWFICLNHITH